MVGTQAEATRERLRHRAVLQLPVGNKVDDRLVIADRPEQAAGNRFRLAFIAGLDIPLAALRVDHIVAGTIAQRVNRLELVLHFGRWMERLAPTAPAQVARGDVAGILPQLGDGRIARDLRHPADRGHRRGHDRADHHGEGQPQRKRRRRHDFVSSFACREISPESTTFPRREMAWNRMTSPSISTTI